MIRIGVDFGGTKIEAAALDEAGRFVARVRLPNPRLYEDSLEVARQVVEEAERQAGIRVDRVGVGIPGSISPATGLSRNANSFWLNDRPLPVDMERVVERRLRLRNDADCLIISEAADGAAAGARVAFGVIIGTGCGGGLYLNGADWPGAGGFAGEWGHTPLPWPTARERGAHACWCGRVDCLETWVSGTAFMEDYRATSGEPLDGEAIITAARAGQGAAIEVLDRYIDRLGRGLATVCDVLDPEVIVLGGGMSNIDELYERLPAVVGRHVFSDTFTTAIRRAAHGDSSGVRGAAWLWPDS
ncbi:MAG: ROK family protein [Caulobacter sp.]|nr:ROK family protein [Caulobacter sp.]